jgi:O-antigen/teichoic acid export membrane protein
MIRGSFARLCAQAANFLLRLGSLMVLARLLSPEDFGLIGMVTAFTGIVNLFKDFGLSSATVQHKSVTDQMMSTLFWINVMVGVLLGLLTVLMAPAIAAFYREPRLFGATAVLAAGLVFNAAGVQHSALLQRQMRFTALAVINTVSSVLGAAVAIAGAKAGYGYWALIAMTITLPLATTIGLWLTTGWVPGWPRRQTGIRSMMRFGGTLTLTGLVDYAACNSEKVLLGRFWGADAIGIYGRAYQLISIPTDNLNWAVGEVAFSALSRLQDDPRRLKSSFLKGYSLILSLTLPITIACALFASDLIFVLLGPKWKDAVPLFRLLAPAIALFAIINPLGWLLNSIGLIARGLKIVLVFAPVMIAAYVLGLPYGPKGVAFAYSAALTLWVIPCSAWCVHNTVVSFWDILLAASRPLASGIVAAAIAFGLQFFYLQSLFPLPRLMLGVGVLLSTYVGMLFYVMGQKPVYVDLLRELRKRPSIDRYALKSQSSVI